MRLKISPEDVLHTDKRGFARLSPEKLREISRFASAQGAAKSGASPQVTAERLKRNRLLAWLAKPYELGVDELKMTDAAEAMGVSRQYLRRALRKYGLGTTRRSTSFMVSSESLRELHEKLSEEFKEHLEPYRHEADIRENFVTIEEAARLLHLPLWQTATFLRIHHVPSRVDDQTTRYDKKAVEACNVDHLEELSILRVTGQYR